MKHRAEIENELGLGELSWQPLPNKLVHYLYEFTNYEHR